MRAYALLASVGCLLTMGAAPTLAGPCADQIADVGRVLSRDQSMGAATTGVISGTVRTTDNTNTAAASSAVDRTSPMTSGAPSASPGGRSSGEGGVKEMNAAAAQVATSPEDVRRQQQGLPTAAQDPVKAAQLNDDKSLAKNKLEEARALDAKNDGGCMAPLNEAKRLANIP